MVGVHNADAAAAGVQVNKQVVVLPLLGVVLVHVCAHTPLAARAPRYELHLQQRSDPRSSPHLLLTTEKCIPNTPAVHYCAPCKHDSFDASSDTSLAVHR